MKRLIFITILTCFSIFANAYDFCVNGIYYKIVSIQNRTVEVTKGEEFSYYLASISIPATVNYKGKDFKVIGIGEEVFYKTNLTKVELPEGLEYIGRGAFREINYKPLEINLPSTLKTIKELAFHKTFVNNFFIPKNVEKIEFEALPNAFCISIEDSDIPLGLYHSQGYLTVNDIYFGRTIFIYMKELKYPYKEVELEPDFESNSPFPFIKFTKSINVTIGKNIKNPTYIFYLNFPDDTKITVQNPTPPQLNLGPLKSNRMFVNWTIEVPRSALQIYQKTKGWSYFLNLEGK